MFGLFAHTQVATGLGVGAAPITAASKMRRCVKKDVHVIRRGAVARARRRGVAVIDCAVSAPLDGRCAPAESQVYFKRGLTERGPTPTRYPIARYSARWGLGRSTGPAGGVGGEPEHGPGASHFLGFTFMFMSSVHVPPALCVTVVTRVYSCLGAAATPAYMAQWLPSRRGRCRFRHGTVSIGMTDPRRSGAAGRRGGAVPRHCSHTHTLASST